MDQIKKAHFVPRFYLRKFADNKEHIFVYDKPTNKSFPTSVTNIASETHFYDLPTDALANKVNLQLIETLLSGLENDFKKIIDNALNTITSKRRITRNQKRYMAIFMTIQYLRTSEQIKNIIESFEKFVKVTFAETHTLNNSDKSLLEELEFNPELKSLQHAEILLDSEIIDYITNILKKHIWIVGINNTSQPLYTSDNPIVRKAQKKDPIHSTVGLDSEGIEIAFPLTPKYLLILRESRFFKKFKLLDCKSKLLSKTDVLRYNRLQVLQSLRQIYCPSNRFNQVLEISKTQPEAFEIKRERVKIRRYSQPNGTLIQFKDEILD